MIIYCDQCRQRHHKLMVCSAKLGGAQVVDGGSQAAKMVVHTESRHGKHAVDSAEARKAYRREWMRAKRAG